MLPGEEFSLIEALGPITEANGYVVSHVVENGFVTNALGGGLSQISTTTFNAAFEAGMEDIAHKPHSRWFDRYPAGRESTLYAPTLDMKWGNNTPYGVLVQAWVDEDSSRVYVRLWSTKYWDVDIVSGSVQLHLADDRLQRLAHLRARERRRLRLLDRRLPDRCPRRQGSEYSRDYSWTYSPWNNVVCGTEPKPDEDDGD